nr:peroxisomal fatty acid beta-oxidation multifunctional protein AIM1 [Ipomoea batatas]
MGGNGKLVTMEIGSDGIAVITLSNPPVNALTLSVIAEMKEHYREAMERDDVKGVVLTGTGGKFCGGLDVNILQKVHSTDGIFKQDQDYCMLMGKRVGEASVSYIIGLQISLGRAGGSS